MYERGPLRTEPEPLPAETALLVQRANRGLGVILLLLALLASAMIGFAKGESLVLGATAHYRAVQHWIFLAWLPIVIYLLARADRETKILERQNPSRAIRWLMTYPLIGASLALAATAAPVGWAVLYGLALGRPIEVEARLLSVDSRWWEEWCSTSGLVEVRGERASLCITNVAGTFPAPGAQLRLAGLQSAAGLYVRSIAVR